MSVWISNSDLVSKLTNKDEKQPYDLLLLDTRDELFYRASHICGSINFPLSKYNNLEEVKDAMNSIPWRFLFSEKQFYIIVFYDEVCDFPAISSLVCEKNNFIVSSRTLFEMLINDIIQESEFNNESDILERKWRRVYLLEKGYNEFYNQYSIHCTSSMNSVLLNDKMKKIKQLKINDHLWIGSFEPLLNTDGEIYKKLKNHNIDSIFIIGDDDKRFKLSLFHAAKFFRCEFINQNQMYDKFYEILGQIEQQIVEEDKVIYITCHDSRTYSSALAIAYVMTKENGLFLNIYKEMFDCIGPLFIPIPIMSRIAEIEQKIKLRQNEPVYPLLCNSLPPKTWFLLNIHEQTDTVFSRMIDNNTESLDNSSFNCITM